MTSTASDPAAHFVEDVVLRDGSTLRLRVPTAADEATLIDFFQALSSDSRYLRFHGATSIDHATVAGALETDWDDRASLLGELAAPGGVVVPSRSRPTCASMTHAGPRSPLRSQTTCTGAEWGVGLLERLAADPAQSGSSSSSPRSCRGTTPCWVSSTTPASRRTPLQGGVVEVTLRLASHGSTVAERRDVRDHVAVAASLVLSSSPARLPSSAPPPGAARSAASSSATCSRRLRRCGLSGQPWRRARRRRRRLHACAEVPPPSISPSSVCRARSVLDAAREALDDRRAGVCVISAGFAETGSDGEARQDELLGLVRAHGARLVGRTASASPRARQAERDVRASCAPAGRVGVLLQSGALGLALLEEADGRGLGLSSFVSIGNKADVSSNDLLEYWEEDAATDVVLLYLESFGNPRKFARVAGRVARTKPILAMRSGTSRPARARRARTRPRSRAPKPRSTRSSGRRACCDSARSRSCSTPPGSSRRSRCHAATAWPCSRTPVVSGILCADACEAAGLDTPATRGRDGAERCSTSSPRKRASPTRSTCSARPRPRRTRWRCPSSRDPGLDAVICLFVPPVVATAADVAAAIARASESADKPVLPVVMSADGTPAGGFAYPESAARALGLAARRAAWLRRPAGEPPKLDRVDRAAASALIADALEASDESGSSPQPSGRCSARTVCRSSKNGTRLRRPLRSLRRPQSAIQSSSRRPRPARTRPNRAACSSTCATPRASRVPATRSPGR